MHHDCGDFRSVLGTTVNFHVAVAPIDLRPPLCETFLFVTVTSSPVSCEYVVCTLLLLPFNTFPLNVLGVQGCYIGQETISRVNAYNGVKKVLQGVSFNEGNRDQVCEGDALVAEESGIRQVQTIDCVE